MEKIQNLINHVAFVVDASGSMETLSDKVVKVFDSEIAYMATKSKGMDQETRVSVFLFNEQSKCLIYDMDVMRLPSLAQYYKPSGGTALIDATIQALDDLNETPQKYSDHAFLLYVQTDGQENRSLKKSSDLSSKINRLPDNWTVAVLVPNKNGADEASRFGFPVNNIQVWEVSEKGMEKAATTIRTATDSFMTGRALGIRGTKNLFKVDANFTPTDVKTQLEEIKPSEYEVLEVRKDRVPLKEFLDSWKIELRKGSNYYELTKPEIIQPHKQVLLMKKTNGKLFGGVNGRKMLSLPNYEVKVSPADHKDYRIFIQSTSSNRCLIKNTQLIVMK